MGKGGRHTLRAIRAARNRGCDLLVQRLERRFGRRVEEDDFVAVRGREGEDEGEGHFGCGLVDLVVERRNVNFVAVEMALGAKW